MKCINPVRNADGSIRFSCGLCIACRINTTTMWTKRLYDEFNLYGFENAMFVTLTYNDEHLPLNGSLVKSDFVNFVKRLRKDLSYEGRKIKVYGVGEYGSQLNRPHYHAIIFGMSPFSKVDRQMIIDNWQLCDEEIFRWKHKGEKWLQGNAIDYVTRANIQYVCKYIQKRLSGSKGEEEYNSKGLVAPFSYKSNGLGLRSCYMQEQFIKDNGFVYLNGEAMPVPRYYKEKLGVKVSMLPKKVKQNKLKILEKLNSKNTTKMVLKSILTKYQKKYGYDFFTKKDIFSSYERECMRYLVDKEVNESNMFEKSYKTIKGVR